MGVVRDPAAGSLLRSRLAPPLSADHLARLRVDAAFSVDPHVNLLLLCAPPGFGKTTALTDFYAQRREQGTHVAIHAGARYRP